MNHLYWQVKHKCNFNKETDLLDVILRENGVEDIDAFFKVNAKNTFDPFLLKNMKTGIETLYSILHNSSPPKIFVKFDSDVDGITSGSVITMFIKDICPEADVKYSISADKTHGIFYSDVTPYIDELDMIIVPDAGSESIEECKRIKEYKDIPILILDHHNFSDKAIYDYTICVNCTDGEYPNNTLSGVGIVYKFLIAYCEQYDLPIETYLKYIEFVALGMIADAMDLRNLETRYYVLEGLKEENHHNEFLKELCERNAESFKLGHTIKNYGWSLAPNLNALVRYGKPDEQINTIRAILGEQQDIEYQPRRKKASDPKPPLEIHTLQWEMARICCNCKSRQDAEVKRFMEKLDQKIKNEKLDDNSVIVVDGNDILTKKTVTGLVANKLMSVYKRPVIVLRDYTTDTYGGSARGYGKGNIANFQHFLNESGLIEAAGHENAMGIKLPHNNLDKLITYCNQHIDKNDLVDVFEVDYEIEADNLKSENIIKIANAYNIWGNGIDEPTFAIIGIHINANDIQGITAGDSDYVGFIKFRYHDMTFIKKYCKKTDYEEITLKDRKCFGVNKKPLNITVIATFELNEYEGNRYPEIVIKQFESIEDTEAQPYIDNINADAVALELSEEISSDKKITKEVTVEDDDFVF